MKNTDRIEVISSELSLVQNGYGGNIVQIIVCSKNVEKWCIYLMMLQFSIITQINVQSDSNKFVMTLRVSENVNNKFANRRAQFKLNHKNSCNLVLSYDELNYWIETSLWAVAGNQHGYHIDLDVRDKNDDITYFVVKYAL